MFSSKYEKCFKLSWLDTKLGSMIALADEEFLYFLMFSDMKDLNKRIEKLKSCMKAEIMAGKTDPICSIKDEIDRYFSGNLKNFKTPLYLEGTLFQQMAWEELQRIPYGTTRSYREQANLIGNSKAYRAVANANGKNPIPIVVPCHRIIHNDGGFGGYGGGLSRKKWLLDHERNL